MKKDNPKIEVYCGIPGSGKSTAANDYIRNNPNWIRVNRDLYRRMFKNAQLCDPKIEDLISVTANNAIHEALRKKLNVIIDNTHVKAKYIEAIIEEFKYEADISYRIFDISVDKAIERDNNREAKVGPDVIKKMYKDFKVLMDSFHFQPHVKIERRPVIEPNWTSSLPQAAWFDLDGTTAIMSPKRGPFDWDKVYLDDPNLSVVEQIEFHKSKGRTIIIVSGRDAICKEMTENWLEDYEIPYDLIFMRPQGDFRKDNIIKREIYENEIKNKYNVVAAYDDRLQVVRELYKMGIFTFSVNQGIIEF